jgi:hypothetical protein
LHVTGLRPVRSIIAAITRASVCNCGCDSRSPDAAVTPIIARAHRSKRAPGAWGVWGTQWGKPGQNRETRKSAAFSTAGQTGAHTPGQNRGTKDFNGLWETGAFPVSQQSDRASWRRFLSAPVPLDAMTPFSGAPILCHPDALGREQGSHRHVKILLRVAGEVRSFAEYLGGIVAGVR